MVNWSGEIREYLKNAQTTESSNWKATGYDQKRWHEQLCIYMRKWVEEHRDMREDTWTNGQRNGVGRHGVWQ